MPAGSLDIGRDRQARQFPVAVPSDPMVYLLWEGAEPPAELRRALGALCAKVTCVGHSASLVQAWVEGDIRQPDSSPSPHSRLIPVGEAPARFRLRVSPPGRLDELRDRYANAQRPRPALWSGYRLEQPAATRPDAPRSWFAPALIVLRRVTGGSLMGRVGDEVALGLESTLLVARTLRDTVMSLCPQPVPEWVSGHTADRSHSKQPHLAFVPLAHIGREYSDGHLLGLAIVVPEQVPTDEQQRCLGPVLFDEVGQPRRLELRMGRVGRWVVQLEERESRPFSLRPEPWTAAAPAHPARRWASVTPVALDRHAKGAERWREVEAIVARAVTRIGLPEPAEVIAGPVSLFPGVPHARRFPSLQRRSDGGRVFHTHAVITFREPVQGPLLVGAGRFQGYGLMRPAADVGDRDDSAAT
jgi:CRISPR-associated protein Csb2